MKKLLIFLATMLMFASCEKTKEQEKEEPTVNYVELQDGFMAYDGVDEGSGYYRTNIMMSTKKMSDPNTDGYTDVLIYLYTKFPLKRIDEHYREVPIGEFTPFYTDGSGVGLTEMMFKVGMHFTDEEGDANLSGSGVIIYDKDDNAEFFAADDTEKTKVSVVLNADGSHTVYASIFDKTLNKEFYFKFTDTKKVFSLDQGNN